MAGKAVATAPDDVKATAGATDYVPSASGTWTAGPVTFVTYAYLTVEGKEVVSEASCDFSYAGTDKSTSAAVTGSSTVTLSPPQPTTLQHGEAGVLRDGDTKQDTWGNALKVATQNILTSE